MARNAPKATYRLLKYVPEILEDYPDGLTTMAIIKEMTARKLYKAQYLKPQGLAYAIKCAMEDDGLPVHYWMYRSRQRCWVHNKYKAEEEQTK